MRKTRLRLTVRPNVVRSNAPSPGACNILGEVADDRRLVPMARPRRAMD